METRSLKGIFQVSCMAIISMITLLLDKLVMNSRRALNLLWRLWMLILKMRGILELEKVLTRLLRS
jgi:hypothetical protein